jgi:MFS family permease
MLATQVTMGAFSAAMAVLTFSGAVSLWHVYLLAALGSAASAFDQPARQSLIPSLVPREDLANAISLNMIMVQMAAVGGPSLAGLVIAGLGIGWAYAFDALSFGAAILSLVLMRDVPQTLPAQRAEISLAAALEGLRFVFSSALIRSTMLLDFFATFFSSAIALLPIFAQDVLHVGARGYGWLYGAPAVGAVSASAVMVRIVDRVERRGWLLIAAVMCYGLATVGFGMSRSFWLTFFCLAMIGASDTVSTVLRNVIRQLATPDRLRGRMTSVNMIFFQGGPQLGELESGLLAQWIGAPLAVVTGGIGCLAATGVLASATPVLRRYRRETHV